MKTWNRERFKTRDRLLEYDASIMPLTPTAGASSIPMIYPWENASLAILSHQIFKLAQASGYTGPEDLLFKRFDAGVIHSYSTLDEFPVPGIVNDLYLDTTTQILYYYVATTNPIDVDKIAIIGGAIVGYSIIGDKTETRLYLPVRALPMEDIIYNCGDAAEYIG